MKPSFQHDIADFELSNALNSIGQYANENNLTPARVKVLFNIGIVSSRLLNEPTNVDELLTRDVLPS